MKLVKIIFGGMLLLIGIIWGWLLSWQLEFYEWYDWVWLICIIAGVLAVSHGIFEMLYSVAIASIIVGLLWGDSLNWVHAPLTEHYSQWLWIWLIAVGSALLILRFTADILREKKWGQRKTEEFDAHTCPKGSEWDSKAKACVYRDTHES